MSEQDPYGVRIGIHIGEMYVNFHASSSEELTDFVIGFAARSTEILNGIAAVNAAANAVEGFLPKNTALGTAEKPPLNKGVRPGSTTVPNCACDIPMTDVRGQTYKKGPNQGKPYPHSFYRSKDCTQNCDPKD